MVALRSLTDEERADMAADLDATRRVRRNLFAFAQVSAGPLLQKLRWQLDACDRHIARYERELQR